MAREEFLQNLRLAKSLMQHGVSTDHSRRSGTAISSALAHSDLWLTTSSVRGFDPSDFQELAADDLSKLERNVARFKAVASEVPAKGPATAKQAAVARRSLETILKMIEPEPAVDTDIEKLEAAIRAVSLPDEVVTWDYRFGNDSTGDPAVWIWFILEDSADDPDAFAVKSSRLSLEINKSLAKVGLDRWQYVRVRSASEQKTLQASGS